MPRASYASDPARSRGREFAVSPEQDLPLEPGPRIAVQRGPFERDRDRIVHSVAFRRLRYKTQVFIAPDGDHYRVRLTHSLEVAQIARVIARALGLDEDLTEALALAHDIGHPPFGHAGEEALEVAMADAGGFDHNAHCLRVLMRLETPYCDHDGLNLTWEMLEGVAKHNGPVAKPSWALAELDAAFPLDLATYPSLEAQVAAIADDIAYDNHDIDDGLRAGFLNLDALLAHPFVADRWRKVERRHPLAPRERQLRELVRDQIGAMVNDVLATTDGRLVGIDHVDQVRAADHSFVSFSQAMAAGERGFKRFMYAELYYHAAQVDTADKARVVIAELFAAYRDDPALMGPDWLARLPPAEPARSRHVADYIAGMTDRFALSQHEGIYGRKVDGLQKV